MKHGLSHILLCAASPLLFADLAQENKNFERTIQLGQQVLERKLVPYNISGIDRHFSTAQQKFAKLSPEHVRKELEAFERIMLQLSVRCNGQPYTPNIGWATQTRTKDYQSEISESFKDWRRSAAALAKFGLHADCEFEIGRINAFRSAAPKLSTLPSDADFDQAFSFYKSIIEERLRLGGRIILLENELDALERTVEFRRSLGGKQKPLNINALRGKLAHWRTAFNTQNYTVCYALERQTDAAMADLRAQAFASDGVTPDVRPGTSFLSTGVFGFGGSWQTLLSTNVRNGSLFRNRKDDFQPYKDPKFNWEVSFDAEDCTFSRYELAGGSWTHAKRKNVYKDRSGKEVNIDVYWSSIAPGVLFDAHTDRISIVESSRGVPLAPDAVAGVFDGKVQLFERGSKIPSAKMSENWLLLLWRENTAPKIPVLVCFEHRPGKIEWGGNGLCIQRAPVVGKYAAATLYGAEAKPAKFGSGWETLPADVLAQSRDTAKHLTCFPLDIDEFYAFEKDGSLRIWNKITKAETLNKGDWTAPVSAYIPFPVAYTLTDRIRPDQPLSKPLAATRFGFYRTVQGDTLSYKLPVPDLLERIVLKPAAGEETLIAELNQTLLSHNGQDIHSEFIRDYNSGVIRNLLSGLCLLSTDAKNVIDQPRQPLQHDLAITGEMSNNGARELGPRNRTPEIRIDPVTGRSAFFGGWRGNNQGAEGIVGDMTFFNQLPLFLAYGRAQMFNDWRIVERHWNRLKEIYTAVDFNQTWRAPGMNTRSSGFILYGDMYGDGLRCSSLMYRLAKAMNEPELAAHALYLATKQNATTINFISPNVIRYNAHVKNLPEALSPKAALGQLGVFQSGFRTAPWKPYPADAWNAPFQTAGCTNDYLFYGTILRFCFRDAEEWLNVFSRELPEWNNHTYLYSTGRSERPLNAWNYIKYLAFSTRNRDRVRRLYRETFPFGYSAEKPFFKTDAKHWKQTYHRLYNAEWFNRANVLPHIITQNDPVWIGDFGRARLVAGTYDRAARTARISLSSDRPDTLTVVSMIPPESIQVNGKSVQPKRGLWECAYEIPLAEGNSEVVLTLPEFSVSDYPYPKKENADTPLKLEKMPAPEELKLANSLPPVFKVGMTSGIDLSAFCNQGFSDSPENMVRKEFWKFPLNDIIRGIPFIFVDPQKNGGKSTIMLKGRHRKELPESVKGIPVNKVVKRLFFLHGCCYNSDNGKVMTYRLNFADGQVRELDIYAGIGTGEWKIAPGGKGLAEVSNARTAHVYPGVRPGQWGEGAGGYIYVWENDVKKIGVTNQDVDQRGLARLTSIDIISAGRAVPVILAITAEE